VERTGRQRSGIIKRHRGPPFTKTSGAMSFIKKCPWCGERFFPRRRRTVCPKCDKPFRYSRAADPWLYLLLALPFVTTANLLGWDGLTAIQWRILSWVAVALVFVGYVGFIYTGELAKRGATQPSAPADGSKKRGHS